MDRDEARSLLGVSATATAAARDEAFRRLALVAHPDAGGDAAELDRLVRARDLLRGVPAVRPVPRANRAVVVPDAPRWRRALEAFGFRPAPRRRRVS